MYSRIGRFVLSSLLAFSTASFVLNPLLVSAGESHWVEVRSPHFSVVTDASEKRGREIAAHFEQMRVVFGTLMTKAKVNLPVPLQIVAFRNTKEIRQVAPLFNGKPTEVAGLFVGGQDRSFILLDASVENPYHVVFHEYAHQLMNGNLDVNLDPWFEEGFAEYFSSIEVDSKQARVGKVPAEDYRILQEFGSMRIADLLRVTQNSKTYNESGDHRTSFYAESAMLMHYIYDNQLMLKAAAYFDLKENKHVPLENAIQQAFGMTPKDFDVALRNYVASGQYRYYVIPAPASIAPENYKTTALKTTDGQALIAEVHLHSLDYQDRSASEFQDILKSDPNHAAACRGLGYFYLEKRDYTQAAEFFKRASQLDPNDARAHYFNGLLTFRQGRMSADAEAMSRELETAIQLDPGFADAYALLAFAQMTSGDEEKALAAMKKAVEISPRNEVYLYNLANLHLANRQPAPAIAILSSLRVTDNPMLAVQVAELLARARRFGLERPGGENGSERAVPALAHRGAGEPSPDEEAAPAPIQKPEPKWGAPQFVRGALTSVDCSSEQSAVLTLLSGGKILKLSVPDRNHVLLIGADQFSCAWSKQKVAINYRQSSTGETQVVSLELQW